MRKKKGVTTVIFLKYCSFCKSYRDCWQGTPVGGLLLCCAYLFTTQFHLPYRQKKTPSIYMRRGGGRLWLAIKLKQKQFFSFHKFVIIVFLFLLLRCGSVLRIMDSLIFSVSTVFNERKMYSNWTRKSCINFLRLLLKKWVRLTTYFCAELWSNGNVLI